MVFIDDQPFLSEDNNAEVQNGRNYNELRVGGLWIFSLKNGFNCLYFYVLQKDRNKCFQLFSENVKLALLITQMSGQLIDV